MHPRRFAPHLGAALLALAVIGVSALAAQEPMATEQLATATGPSTVSGPSGSASEAAGEVTQAGPQTRTVTRTTTEEGSSIPGAIYDPGVSDTEIVIGGSTFTSGPAAVYGEQIAVGFQAGVDYINETGGINGRRVIAKIYDDGGDPAKQFANTKRLVEVDKAFALSMVYAPISGPYVAEQKVPVFHLGQFNEEFVHPYWFPVGGPQRLASYATADFGYNKLGARSVAVFYIDAGAVNYSLDYAKQVASDWEAWGAEVPVLAPFAPTQTSCGDAIGQARDAGVDFIQFEVDVSKVINCGIEAQLQGYKPPLGWGGYLIGVPATHEGLGDYALGMYAFDAFGANYDVGVYQEAVRRVSSKTESYSSVTISYFISALLMRDSIAKLGDNITRERLVNVLNTFTDWTPGLTTHENQPIWTWRPDCHVALKGGYVIQIQKNDEGDLRWEQITPQFPASVLPPGVQPPPEFRACDSFRTESLYK